MPNQNDDWQAYGFEVPIRVWVVSSTGGAGYSAVLNAFGYSGCLSINGRIAVSRLANNCGCSFSCCSNNCFI